MNKLFLLGFVCVIFIVSCHTKHFKVNKTEAMNANESLSVIDNGMTLNIDTSGTKGNNSVLFFDSTCVITALNNKANMLVANPGFNPTLLTFAIQNELHNITIVNLSTGNPFEDQQQPLTEMPNWLEKITELKYLRLENIKIRDLSFLQSSKIKQLILIKVELENRNDLLKDISNLTDLQYLVYNNLFTHKEVLFIKSKLPEVVILSEVEYNKKVEAGLINMQE